MVNINKKKKKKVSGGGCELGTPAPLTLAR